MLRELSDPPVDVDEPDECYWAQRGMRPVSDEESARWQAELVLALGPPQGGLLADLDPMSLGGDARVELLRARERHACWVAAQQQVALAAVVQATRDLGLEGTWPGTRSGSHYACRRARPTSGWSARWR